MDGGTLFGLTGQHHGVLENVVVYRDRYSQGGKIGGKMKNLSQKSDYCEVQQKGLRKSEALWD